MSQHAITGNTLYYGDTLDILRDYIPSGGSRRPKKVKD
jgi:hypothetical protein